jgi:threonine dehydrogenase-like Zn-dependent dehydrogenase
VKLRELKDDEVLVEIVASGICHTDLHCGNTPDDKGVPAVFYPRVLGHEGMSPELHTHRTALTDSKVLAMSRKSGLP